MDIKEMIETILDQYEPTFDKQTAKVLRDYFTTHAEEIETLLKSTPTDEEMVYAAIEKQLAPLNLPPDEYRKKKEILEKIVFENMSYAEAIDIDQSILEGFYTMGYTHYNHGKYKEAQIFFSYLTLLDTKDPRYFYATAATYHMLKDYKVALGYYDICTKLDWLNPIPWFHQADCYFELENFPMALYCLDQVLNRARNSKIYEKMYDKAKVFHEIVAKKVDALFKQESTL